MNPGSDKPATLVQDGSKTAPAGGEATFAATVSTRSGATTPVTRPRLRRLSPGNSRNAAPGAGKARENRNQARKPSRKKPRKQPRRKIDKEVGSRTVPAQLQDALRLLGGLHSSWQDAMETHRLRVEGQFKLAEQMLKADKRSKAKDLDRVRAALKVRMKPKKGRAKDLRRVEEALDQVLARVGNEA